MAQHVRISTLRAEIARAVGFPPEAKFTLRKRDGSPIDQRISFAESGIGRDGIVLVEQNGTGPHFPANLPWRRNTFRGPSAYRVLPIYLAIDTSWTMNVDIMDRINEELAELRLTMLREPRLCEICHVSVLTFDDTARVALPLTDVSRVAMPPLQADGRGTAYGPLFELLRTTIAADLYDLMRSGRRPYRPAVFFLSDGQPTDDDRAWRARHSALTDPRGFHGAPHIVAFGFGEATAATIRAVGTLRAYRRPAAEITSFMDVLLTSLLHSTRRAGPGDDPFELDDDAPPGWERLPDAPPEEDT
ncbi:vWA domain-containing protein [Dactylosporangium sp. McL0621]|uniref:vWA domain-containing protein n=1 Tax=Dactylosporangium sp. McL0621 TaxID=3415678 RepID=UPI003CF65D6F